MSSWNPEPCAIYPQLCITARPPYACPVKHHCQSFFFSPTLTQARANTPERAHTCVSGRACTCAQRKKRIVTHATLFTQTPITLHLVCDLIQCIDNLPVSGTQPTDRFQGASLCAALPPRWAGYSDLNPKRHERRRGELRAPDKLQRHRSKITSRAEVMQRQDVKWPRL